MTVRIRRLGADFQQVSEALAGHPSISILNVHGNPPDRYQIQYKIKSLIETVEGEIVEGVEHTAEFYLTLSYPRQAPQCRMLTPVFHPNIAPHAVCIGDHWAAGESLLHLIIRVGEMLAFQSYNIKSPLNGSAARWAEEHINELPTDDRDLTPGSSIQSSMAKGSGGCECCGRTDLELNECTNSHNVCPNCLVQCGRCNSTFCRLCSMSTCVICGRLICESCRITCPQCQRTALCREHMVPCGVCGEMVCTDCIVQCSNCDKSVCLAEIGRCAHCSEISCRSHLETCSGCQQEICQKHFTECSQCGVRGCPDCIFECHVCGQRLCLDHVAQCGDCKAILCAEHSHECSKCGKKHCADHLYTDQHLCWKCGGRLPVIGP